MKRSAKYPLMALGAYLALIGVLAIATSGPAYTQSGQPNGPNVSVINTPAEPVPMRDVDNPARQPFHLQMFGDNNSFTVPAGKRLVIEFVSGRIHTNSDRRDAALFTLLGSSQISNVFVPTLSGIGAGVNQ